MRDGENSTRLPCPDNLTDPPPVLAGLRLAFAETPQPQLSSGVSRSRAHGAAQPTDDSRLVFLAFNRAGELD